MTRLLSTATVLLVLTLAPGVAFADDEPRSTSTESNTTEAEDPEDQKRRDTYTAQPDEANDAFTLEANGNGGSSSGSDGSDGGTHWDRYLRVDARACGAMSDIDTISAIVATPGACDEGMLDIGITPDCDGVWLDALWVQRVRPDGTYAEPEQLTDNECITPADIAAEAQREFATMRITAPPAIVQGGEPMLVNVHYPAYTTAEPQELEAVLLGVPVVIRADPAEFTWDFDDPHGAGGGTLTTTDPGHPWRDGDPLPDATWVGHTYSRLGDPDTDAGVHRDAEGDVYRTDIAVTLTTTWQGRFRLQGTSTWTDIDGAITTTSTTDPATVTEARTRLVCEDLHGNSFC